MPATEKPKHARKRGRLPGQSKHPGVVPVLVNGKWQARWKDPRTGTSKCKTLDTVGATNERLRLDWMKRKAKDIAKESKVLRERREKGESIGRTTFAAARDRYLAHLDVRVARFLQDPERRDKEAMRPATRDSYKHSLRVFVEWSDESPRESVEDLSAVDLVAFADWLRARPKRGSSRGLKLKDKRPASDELLSGTAIAHFLKECRTFAFWLKKRGLLPNVTREEIKDALSYKKPSPTIDPLAPEEVRDALRAVIRHDAAEFPMVVRGPSGTVVESDTYTSKHAPIGPIVLAALLCGARPGELRNLRWDDVTLDPDGDGGRVRIVAHTSKGKRERDVDLVISPALARLLRVLAVRRGSDEFVFGGAAAFSDSVLRKALARVVTSYGAPRRFSLTTLRKTVSSTLNHLRSAFGDATTFRASRMLGHSIAVMERHYAKPLDGIDEDAKTIEAALRVEKEVAALIDLARGESVDLAAVAS